MTQEEIIEMARQVGIRGPVIDFHKNELEAFAKLVAAAAASKEREACAKVCETRQAEWKKAGVWGHLDEFHNMAKAIRARGNL